MYLVLVPSEALLSFQPSFCVYHINRDLIASHGGWDKFQCALSTVKKIADKHGVTLQTVALRWQMDQGVFPVVTMDWAPNQWRPFGHHAKYGKQPGLDQQLFHKASFLDEDDMAALTRAVK